MEQTTRGHCLCRAVTYEYTGAPLWVLHCHCESCRRQTSSAVATFVGLERAQVRFTGAAPAVYESSPGVRRSFCGRCGAPIAYESDRVPGEIHLYAGTLADPAALAPSRHVFVAEQLPWFEVADDLPRYLATSRGVAPAWHGPRPRSA
jgi:hypothetical protein